MYGLSYASPWLHSPAHYRDNEQVIQMIQESIEGERNDEMFYDALIRLAPTEQQKDVIRSIRDDERKHRQMFRSMYTYLTGQAPVVKEGEAETLPASYVDGIETALLGELKAFEKYRKIYLQIAPELRNWMFEIMTDEIKHAGYYNWLYAKNKK
ncbi:ferritin-like domain-containing protein [Paenibacillus sp. H1-7]|uniref:ferritin-like domain-containing protein n=1 Tax=Paenibacillus sp. H1-7 TaxID=2282849 RepID=UPI001EF96A88|nr:ferritin-like domain-containing protein [Paenibacillus sp. H1-7]ULL13491.1 ferritin-like domain-containing protein [Paenibacillus sp. H1-7]